MESDMVQRKRIRYFDVQTLVQINAKVVLLTGDTHKFAREDRQRLRKLLTNVRNRANDLERTESIIEKASLLIFGIASGQHFHEGNKRTALTAGEVFLKANGYTIDMKEKELVQMIDKAGIGQGSLSKLSEILRRLIRNV